MARGARWAPVAAAVAAAALLTGAAAVTAEQAGCDEPAAWVVDSDRAQLVGGCFDRDELPVAPPAVPGPARPTPQGD